METPKRPGSITSLLVGGIVLVFLLMGFVLVFLPIVGCPREGFLETGEGCLLCRGTGKTSRFNVWQSQRDEGLLGLTPKEVSAIEGVGFVRENRARMIALVGIRVGEVLRPQKKKSAIKELFQTGKFEAVEIMEIPHPTNPNRIIVRISVVEK